MKSTITFLTLCFFALITQAQNIEFTFANAEITNDGTDDYYEVDILVATVDNLADFKMGVGLLYINYNNAAFGENIKNNGHVIFSYPDGEDYIRNDKNVIGYYSGDVINDNTVSRVAYAFDQSASAGTFLANNVTATPRKLVHLAIKFIDSSLDPMIAFEDNETQPPGVDQGRDQFYTACGPFTDGIAVADCTNYPGTQLQDANFTSTDAVLSANKDLALNGFSVHPNPVKNRVYVSGGTVPKRIEVFGIDGKKLLDESDVDNVGVDQLSNGMYLVKLSAPNGSSQVFKVVKE